MGADHVRDRLANGAQRRHALAPPPCARYSTRQAMISVPCHSAGRKGSGGAFRITNQQINRPEGGSEVAIEAKQVPGLVERMYDQAGHHLRPQRMQPELEGRDDAEVAAAAAERPEQVGILLLVAGPSSRRPSPRRRREIVEVSPNLRRDPSEAAAERQPGDAGGRVDAGRRWRVRGLGLAVELAQRGAGSTRAAARPDRPRHRFIGADRSSARPRTALPAMLWPPPRTASAERARARSRRRADVRGAGAATITPGVRSNIAFQTLRAAS